MNCWLVASIQAQTFDALKVYADYRSFISAKKGQEEAFAKEARKAYGLSGEALRDHYNTTIADAYTRYMNVLITYPPNAQAALNNPEDSKLSQAILACIAEEAKMLDANYAVVGALAAEEYDKLSEYTQQYNDISARQFALQTEMNSEWQKFLERYGIELRTE